MNCSLNGTDLKGTVPVGLPPVKSATGKMLILGRTYTNASEADYKTVKSK